MTNDFLDELDKELETVSTPAPIKETVKKDLPKVSKNESPVKKEFTKKDNNRNNNK
ncbi:MAG: hypothetical protein U9Q66_04280 [Patescibacteria group bacterium]|nr:hypothetical protein [Patescibacteria group bacterium]